MRTVQIEQSVRRFLLEWPGLALFCTQNGWIDDESLEFEIQERQDDELTVAVWFDEILMEGSGCLAGREPCFGKLRLKMDGSGKILRVEVI